MDSRDEPTDSSASDAAEPATSTHQTDEDADEIGGFIFNNSPESDNSNPEHEAERLADREQERIVDLVRLQPTKNAELQDEWGLASGSDVHQYLESQLKKYYYRDDDGYIRTTNAAEEFAQHHQEVYQDVTEPNDNPDVEDAAPDLQRRDLVIALVTLTQELGHLPNADEINEHGEYRHQRYREEFGDLFNAYQTAGILPDDVTRQDFYGEDQPKSDSEGQAEAEEDTPEAPATSDQTEPSRRELLDEIKRLDASLDRIPYESDIDQDGMFTAYTYRDRFGSWDEALEAAGIDKEAVLLEDMQQVVDTVGGDLTQPAMNEHGKYSASMAARFFGSWSNAKERLEEWDASKDEEDASAAEPVEVDASSVDRPSFDVPDDVDDADLVEEIQRFAELIDEPPTEELVVAYGRYSAEEYRAAFGSWEDALETAGYDPDNLPDWSRRTHSNVDVLDGLRAAADELGHAPTTTETGKLIDFSPGLASLRFGSWSTALETAGLDPSERPSVQDKETSEETEEADTGEPGDGRGYEDDWEAADDDPIGSVIDDTLEDMLLSDDDDDGPL